MEKVFRVETPASPDHLFEIVSDLSTFPQWIEVVHRVDPTSSDSNVVTAEGHDEEPTWWVTLRAQLGPLARSKRLRMGRTINIAPTAETPGHVRFERAETDGRDHAEWAMEITVGPTKSNVANSGSLAQCHLFYGGSLWSRLLDGQLDAVADRATVKLQDLADSSRPSPT